MEDSPRNLMFQDEMVSLSLRASIAGSLAVVAILSLSSLSLAQSLSPQAGVPHRSVPRIRTLTNGAATSTNWSGYAVTGPAGSVTDAKGSWIVPSVICSSAASYSSFWVGIDGFGSNTVEQTGTDSDCQNGIPTYYAWYEFYPGPAFLITGITVRPGDRISAEAIYSSGLVTVTITDTTTAQSFTTSGGAGALRSSAEWIAEAPSSAGGVLPLANFGTAYLGQDNTGLSPTNYATVNGVTGPISSFGPSVQEITMVSSSGTTEAQPSPLSTDGTSFSVAWGGGSTSTTSSATTTSGNGTPNLTINTRDTTGVALTGYWTELSQNGQVLANGYTPATYTLNSGQTYTLEADGYASCSFDHWLDTNSPNNLRDVSITSDTSLTAVLNCGNTVTTTTTTTATTTTSTTSTTTTTLAGSSQISVSTVNSAGAPINGYYTTLWQNGVMLQWCYSPCSFVVSNGQTYQVAVADYGGETFSHWSDGITNIFHTVTLGSISITLSLTAVYTP
ncbi:MAG: hypothetical protein E6K86_01960 [Thaumarchaeota archaeon]|nr:MAG: hypothetical protein E6K86_01960 [Nitrososphaerota archaeon]